MSKKNPLAVLKELYGDISVEEVTIASLLTRHYHETKNALFLWEAYLLARKRQVGQNVTIPYEVMQYFDRCAAALLMPNRSTTASAHRTHWWQKQLNSSRAARRMSSSVKPTTCATRRSRQVHI